MKNEYPVVCYKLLEQVFLKLFIFLMFCPEALKKKNGTSIKKKNSLPEKTFSRYFMGVLLFSKSYLKIDTLKEA